ncbi:TRL-like family protein [Leptospira ognonensis]|uniref:TRL-like family protein n=1 Tax=Leptospira ognonensis TaxID=2484945 RepID=A0A4R9KAV9_9LEPT|nr:TRL-like family protein [Leptospira ognonensis]TGL63131.1 TRL-like family protein [Leptospira ognonensis]
MKPALAYLIVFCLWNAFACASTGVGPQSLLYADHTISIYSDGEQGRKQGESCSHSVLGLIAWGDASTQKSQKSAYVNKIKSIDQRSLSILGIYAKLCTVVKGN